MLNHTEQELPATMRFHSPTSPVYAKCQGGIGEIILNRPEKKNAMNLEMWRLLAEAAAWCSETPDIQIVIVRGANMDAFSAGGDIAEFPTVRANATENRAYNTAVRQAVFGLKHLAKPTIAMIAGHCVGGGCEIAVACDLRFAADTTQIGVPPAKLGFVYDVAETKMLADLVGPSRAKDILFSARLLGADEAYRIGLVDKVYSSDVLEIEVQAYAAQLLQNAQNSIRGAKAIIDGLYEGEPVDSPLLLKVVEDALDSPQYREGVHAFVEKRKPQFPSI